MSVDLPGCSDGGAFDLDVDRGRLLVVVRSPHAHLALFHPADPLLSSYHFSLSFFRRSGKDGSCTLRAFPAGVEPSVSRAFAIMSALILGAGTMDSGAKIAYGLVVAAALLVVAGIGYREFERQRNIADVNHAFAELVKISKDPDPMRIRAGAARRERVHNLRRELRAGQECIGGVVILIDGDSYRQLGRVGDPVKCSGRYADRPIR